MRKLLDPQELWDSFTVAEKRCLVIACPSLTNDHRELYKLTWLELGIYTQKELVKLDWEFMLGKRF